MKSRTLSCEKTIVLKDITRFAPLWALYLIGGFLVLLSNYDQYEGSAFARNLANTIGPFSILNLCYAAVVAQLLFGDQFNSRLCNALHAMPMRRETWFLSHTASGILFSLVPNLLFLPVLMLMCGKLWFVALIWLMGMFLSYLFFFGTAVLSAFCTGNRFAMLAVYFILNFGSWIANWFWVVLYQPLMYGVTTPDEIFHILSPVVHLTSKISDFVLFSRDGEFYGSRGRWTYEGFGDAWGYLGIVALVGLVCLVIGLLLYRRRALETAGDFIAVNPLKPVFCVIVSLGAGCIFSVIGELFTGYRVSAMVFGTVGIVVGYFAAQMMLQRMVKVFNRRAFARLGILLGAIVVSFVVVFLDPLGITHWLPEVDDVEYVEMNGAYRSDGYLMITDPAHIETVIELHRLAVDEWRSDANIKSVSIRYRLKNGTVASRNYQIDSNENAYQVYLSLMSEPQVFLGYEDWDECVDSRKEIYLDGEPLEYLFSDEELRELLECIRKDVELGRFDGEEDFKNVSYVCNLRIVTKSGDKYLQVFSDAVNTYRWIKEHNQVLGIGIL